MPRHKEIKKLNYNPQKIVNLVMDIEKYPEFLPWCIGAKITEKTSDNELKADLAIKFKGIFQKYSSNVTLSQISENYFEVKAEATSGPFKNLINLWHIKSTENENECDVDFFIDFEFKSRILNKMIGPIFEKATNKMIEAFENRAQDLFRSSK